ncbi:MAG: hypothetical protein ACKOGJ_03835 [Phycisphaerales bacterium]
MTGEPRPRAPLWNRGFVSLLFTQFFEAASDNVIQGTLSFAVAVGAPWETVFGDGGNGIVGFVFVVPFVLLSAFGGRIADRCSKSRVTVGSPPWITNGFPPRPRGTTRCTIVPS